MILFPAHQCLPSIQDIHHRRTRIVQNLHSAPSPGWQLGIQEGAADWDEDWDKFEDEGFTFVKELTLDVSNVLAPPKQKSSAVQKEKAPPVEGPTASSPKVDIKSEKPQSADDKVAENGAAYDKNEEESAKSAPNSPFATSTVGSPSRESLDSNYGRTTGTEASPVIRNLKVMIMGVLDLCFPVTKVSMNQHGGHLTLMMTLTRCGVSMQLVPPRIWIRRVIRITTFLALGSSASTLSGLGHHKEVAFPRRAALLLLTILFPAHQCLPSIQDIHHQGTRINQNLHSTPSPSLIRLEAPKILHTSLNQKRLADLILCAVVEILIRVMDFQHLMTSQTLLALQRHLGRHWTVKHQEETRTPLDLHGHFGFHWTVKPPEENQIFSGLQQRHLGRHSTVKLQEETRTHLGLLHLGHHSTVKLLGETRTHLGLQGLSGHQWRLREKTLIIGVHFSRLVVLRFVFSVQSPFKAFLLWRGGTGLVFYALKSLSL